ncbi:ABC transporter substrate-binding protein [Paenibacillus arenosi]|uniref:ABC transporter substrate-binding protein n=1 Tax=Paenibacillus arenosi TaxID=2774142 RepID=A0ABR9B1M5_9BACL|nr:ABC transporter substrate-binding protein [Paenibacillus arenosi]MBD8499327.1 ABC transporter substrate-binding protein [Paenibacillus arenosi]
MVLDSFSKGRNAWRTRVSVILCSAIIVGLLAGCGDSPSKEDASAKQSSSNASTTEVAPAGQQSAAPSERTITDELGNEVKLPAEVKSVFAPNMEDSLVALGVSPVAQWSNGKLGHFYLQDQLKDVPKIDHSGGLPGPEVLMAHNPDLIVLHAESYAKNGAYENYAKIAPTYVFKNAAGDIEKSLITLGDLLGKSNEAEQAVQAYKQKVSEAKDKLSSVVGDKKVAIIRFAPRGVSLMGGEYFCGYALHQDLGLGMSKLVENKTAANISLEILPELDADFIFVINAYDQGTERMTEMMASDIWKSMPAVKNGHVYEVNNQHWLGSGLIAYEKIIDDTVRLLTSK